MKPAFKIVIILLLAGAGAAAALHFGNRMRGEASRPGRTQLAETQPATDADRAAEARGGYKLLRSFVTIALRGKLQIGKQQLSYTAYADLADDQPKFYLYTEIPGAHRILSHFGGRAFEIVKPGNEPQTKAVDAATAADLLVKARAFWLLARFPFGDAWTSDATKTFKRERDGWTLKLDDQNRFVSMELEGAEGHESWQFEGLIESLGVPFPRKITSFMNKIEVWSLTNESFTGHANIPDATYQGIPTIEVK
ncbi:MAG: hypothetical protein HY286_07475 [Planctomycetes bacterium]|nr:hypothetical protein [Planctomycetota bacterium]